MYPEIGKGFISEIKEFRRIPLGQTERFFLTLFSSGDDSAYGIWSKENKGEYKMAYKNVRKVLRRLFTLGLLEEVEGKFKRNAKPYKLTSSGLLQILLYGYFIPSFLKNEYKNGIIMETLLFNFFEVESIDCFLTVPRLFSLSNYLQRCSERILSIVERYRTSTYKLKKESLPLDLQSAIKDEVRRFVFEIVTSTNEKRAEVVMISDKNIEYGRFSYNVGQDPESDIFSGLDNVDESTRFRLLFDLKEDHKYYFPVLSLKYDRKFIKVLKDVRNDFQSGYEVFT